MNAYSRRHSSLYTLSRLGGTVDVASPICEDCTPGPTSAHGGASIPAEARDKIHVGVTLSYGVFAYRLPKLVDGIEQGEDSFSHSLVGAREIVLRSRAFSPRVAAPRPARIDPLTLTAVRLKDHRRSNT